MNYSITWRLATQDELERCEVTDHANLIDGAGVVLYNGELVGICNEYGTCVWHIESKRADATPETVRDAIERLNEAATDVIGELL